MKKILFVCHGNICRSAMAEFMMKDLLRKEGKAKDYKVDSAGVSAEESGNDMYWHAKEKLDQKGIPYQAHHARKVTKNDFNAYDLIVCMDDGNLAALKRMQPAGSHARVRKLLGRANVSDPWYTEDFETAYRDIDKGCRMLLAGER